MDKDLQQLPSIGAVWAATPPTQIPMFSVTLTINVPTHAKVARHTLTGQIEISEIQIADLISLRDSISEQIVALQAQEQSGWEPL